MSRSMPALMGILLIAALTLGDDKPSAAKAPVIRLTVDAEGAIRVAGQRKPFPSSKALRDFLSKEVEKAAGKLSGKPAVVISLDGNLEYGRLLAILDVCANAKITDLKAHLALDENSSAPVQFELHSPARAKHLVIPISEAHKEEADDNLWDMALTLRSLKDPRNAGRLSWMTLSAMYSLVHGEINAVDWEDVLLEKLKAIPAFRGENVRLTIRADEDLHSRSLLKVLERTRKAGIKKVIALSPYEEEMFLTGLDQSLTPQTPWLYEAGPLEAEDLILYGTFDVNDGLGVVAFKEVYGRLIPTPIGASRGFDPVPGGLGWRRGPGRERTALEMGGSHASEAAVARGLRWLALHQAPEGHWSLEKFNEHARESLSAEKYRDDRSPGKGQMNDTAGAAFGMLPFLAAGISHKSGNNPHDEQYVKTVARGLDYLLSRQQKDGSFPGGMYAHALGTIALCEIYGLTGDRMLRRQAQAALHYIAEAQDPMSGGWRYQPRQGGDTSVTGWQVQALKAGQMAGLKVPQVTLVGATRWLNSCETTDGGGYGYTGPGDAPAMTAVGLLCRQYLGTPRRNPDLCNGVKKLMASAPPTGRNIYYEYYATQVFHHMSGEYWDFWNGDGKRKGMRDILISSQDRDGSWDPRGDGTASAGGRIMQTSLSLLTLEVYYRHVPIYQRLERQRHR